LLCVFAALTALNRIAFGAHFLSDVLIAAGLMTTLAIGLAHLIYGRPGVQSCDIKLDAALGELGHRMHAWRRKTITRLVIAASRLSLAPAMLQPAPATAAEREG
jgi:lipid A 4'-phosphatase